MRFYKWLSYSYSTISSLHGIVLVYLGNFGGSRDAEFRWTHFTAHPYESFWSSSDGSRYNHSTKAAVFGVLGPLDYLDVNGRQAPFSAQLQRPALIIKNQTS